MSVLDEVYGNDNNPLDAVYGATEEAEGPSLLWKASNLIPIVALERLTRPARKMASDAYKVGRADKSAGLREGLIPWTPDFIGEDVTLDIHGKQVTLPGLDTRLRERAEEIASQVDPEMQARVSKQLVEGKLWPVQEGQPWYSIDPELVPDAISTWAASVGDQAATMIQTLAGKVIGGILGRVAGTAIGGAGGAPAGGVGAAPGAIVGGTVGGKIGGHIGGAIPNIANETAGYMHDAEFWGISDRKIMEENARYYGIASGLMEYAQNAVELAAARGVLKLGAKEVTKRGLVVQALKELGIAGAEGLTEVSQDGLERFFLRRAAEQMKAQDPNFQMPNIPDTFAGWKRTFAQAAGTSAILRGAGHAASGTMQHLYGQERVQADQTVENPLMEEPEAPVYGAQPQIMPEADVEDIDNEQLRTEGETVLTAQEQADLDQLEVGPETEQGQEAQVEQDEDEHMIVGGGEKGVPSGTVKVPLYIGNVTMRAKVQWAKAINAAREKAKLAGKDVRPVDLGPHKEGAFPTKRAKIELDVDQARDLEQDLTEALDEALASETEFDSLDIADIKATWGDIRELRRALGLPTGKMPFRVIQAGKTIVAVVPNTTERIYAGIEGPNKRVLADLSYADLVTQEEALKAGLKKAAADAKHAFSVGGKEATAKLRERVRELKRKARAIKLAKAARKRLTRQLTKRVSSRIEPSYRRAIQSIVDRIDPRTRTKDTQAWIDKAQADYGANPDMFVRTRSKADQTLLKRGQQIPVNRMSTRQLEALVEERYRLTREGRGVAEREKRRRSVQEAGFIQDGTDALKSVRDRGRLDPGQETDNATWFERLVDRFRGLKGDVGFGAYRIDRMMEYLDGFKRGFFTHIWEKVKGDLHTSRERRSIRAREFIQAMKDMDIDGARWMTESLPFRKSDGTVHKLTPWQMLGVYIQSRHATGKVHLIEGNRFSERDLREIAKLVEADSRLTAAHQWLVKRQQEQWKALTQRLRSIGMDPTQFTQIKEYLPLMIADKDMVEQDDVLQKFLGQFVPQEMLPKGFLKERQEGARQAIELDALTLYMHSIDQVEHVMAMAPILSRVGKLLSNQEFRKTLNDKTYGKGAEIWTRWLMDIGRDRVVREQAWYDKMIGYMQRNAVLYAIGWNLPSVLKQIPALFVGFSEDPRMVTFLTENMMALSSPARFKEFRNQARERSSVLRHRNIEPELRAMWNRPHLQAMMKKQFGHGGTELDQQATSWMRAMDDWLTTLAWKCRYDAALSEGYDERAAIRLTDQTVQKTQQMASPEDLPHLFRGGTIASILNLFQNQGNQELNYWVHDIYGKAASGKITPSQAAWRVMMAAILPIAVFSVVSHGGSRRDEDEEEMPFAWRAAGYVFGNMPIVGNLANTLVNGFGGGADLWEMPMEGVEQVASGIRNQDLGVGLKGVAKVAAGALPTKGLINSQAVRTIEGAYDLETGETDDARRLVWSKSMLGKDRKRKSSRRGGIR